MAKEPARRWILCPRCDAPQEVSQNAKSVSCPGCHRNITTQDVDVDEYCARIEMYAAGRVTVGKKGTLIAEVRADGLLIKGEVKGPVRSRGPVVLEKSGRLFGNLSSPTLAVAEGAQLVGRIVTGNAAAQLGSGVESLPPPPLSAPAA